ncbi:MAG: non-canonical purine NTP pyrophosphatase, partial [Cyclobacteriaceae bacterium]|nr:non-canonical purine NTP pyrophosphatase [Cyclobacteriaceae bacterium HetDA_MAG_MS6]
MQLYFATHNPNKLKEIQQIIPSNYKVMGLDDLGHHEEIAETGNTLEENSALKAQAIHRGYGVACFSDDSGLEVASLGNRPGVKSARFAGEQRNDNDNMNLLLENLQDKTSRKARFRTVITYIDESGEQHQFEGTVAGEIT